MLPITVQCFSIIIHTHGNKWVFNSQNTQHCFIYLIICDFKNDVDNFKLSVTKVLLFFFSGSVIVHIFTILPHAHKYKQIYKSCTQVNCWSDMEESYCCVKCVLCPYWRLYHIYLYVSKPLYKKICHWHAHQLVINQITQFIWLMMIFSLSRIMFSYKWSHNKFLRWTALLFIIYSVDQINLNESVLFILDLIKMLP